MSMITKNDLNIANTTFEDLSFIEEEEEEEEETNF